MDWRDRVLRGDPFPMKRSLPRRGLVIVAVVVGIVLALRPRRAHSP
jgi:hypothetical protein